MEWCAQELAPITINLFIAGSIGGILCLLGLAAWRALDAERWPRGLGFEVFGSLAACLASSALLTSSVSLTADSPGRLFSWAGEDPTRWLLLGGLGVLLLGVAVLVTIRSVQTRLLLTWLESRPEIDPLDIEALEAENRQVEKAELAGSKALTIALLLTAFFATWLVVGGLCPDDSQAATSDITSGPVDVKP